MVAGSAGNFGHTSRWHTRTPNAPKKQGNSWVVERKSSGVGYGKNAQPKKEESFGRKKQMDFYAGLEKCNKSKKKRNSNKKAKGVVR